MQVLAHQTMPDMDSLDCPERKDIACVIDGPHNDYILQVMVVKLPLKSSGLKAQHVRFRYGHAERTK